MFDNYLREIKNEPGASKFNTKSYQHLEMGPVPNSFKINVNFYKLRDIPWFTIPPVNPLNIISTPLYPSNVDDHLKHLDLLQLKVKDAQLEKLATETH